MSATHAVTAVDGTGLSAAAVTYIGTIRRSEGNTLLVFAALTLAFILIGTCVFVWLCRSRRIPPHRYGHVRRCTGPAFYTLGEAAV
ncbi:hypothetical protein NESM_000428000 [Novymonas esmeraldas]|uniref:Uncharacterized protein n=1 Tax=Novymonas esmeraldas TaxID=1808958 RepID=A0AAW0ENL3_9TRYP